MRPIENPIITNIMILLFLLYLWLAHPIEECVQNERNADKMVWRIFCQILFEVPNTGIHLHMVRNIEGLIGPWKKGLNLGLGFQDLGFALAFEWFRQTTHSETNYE